MRKKLRKLHKTYQLKTKRQVRRLNRLRRHPVAIPLAGLIVLSLLSFVGLVLINSHSTKFKPITAYIVLISHDGQKQTVPTNEPTVGALLAKLGIGLGTGDVVEPNAATPINQDNFRVNVYRAVPVEVIDGSSSTFALSAATTPRAIAAQAGITVYPEDDISAQSVSNFLAQHTLAEQIVINRATPVNVNLYGTPTVIRTHAQTVAALLTQEHIKLGKSDTIQPAAATAITPNAQVFVIRQGTKLETVTQDIPMPMQTIEDSSLTFGTSAVRQQGSPGQELITYQDNLQNGAVVSRTQIQVVVTVQPVTQIVARGQAVQIPADKESVMADAGIAASDYAYVNYIVSNESGWCPTKLQGQIGYCPGYAPASIPSGLGYGLGQATPGSKMSSFGADWQTNPVTQLRWATSYADARYGSWGAAYDYWYTHHNW